MKLNIACRVLLVAFAALSLAPSHADLTTTVKMTMDMSKMTINGQPISQNQLAMIEKSPMFAGGLDMTTYQSGNKLKSVTSVSTSITDLDAKTTTILLPTNKTYMVMSLDDSKLKSMTANTEGNAVDMSSTKTILGHEAHLFKLYFKNPMMTMTGYAWITQDFPSPPSIQSSNPMMDILKAKLAGVPLKMNADVTSSTFGQIGMVYEVTSLNSDPIAATEFAMPDGYTKIAAPTMPNMPAQPAH